MATIDLSDVEFLRRRVGSCPECGVLVGLYHRRGGQVEPRAFRQLGYAVLQVEWSEAAASQGVDCGPLAAHRCGSGLVLGAGGHVLVDGERLHQAEPLPAAAGGRGAARGRR